jgi:hypothetical protein
MKRLVLFMSILSISILLLFNFGLARADDDLPKRLSFDRYQGILKRSPFAVASAVALPAATPDFAKGLYVANAARTPDADLVTVMSSDDKNVKEYLSTKAPNEHGYAVANIEWSNQPGATKVTISKDGKFATLAFNQALISTPLANMPTQPQAPLPVQTGAPAINLPKPVRSPFPTPPPHVRGVIQRNPPPVTPQPPIPDED